MSVHQAIVDRLKAQVTALKSVKGAAELAALDNRLTVEPAAFRFAGGEMIGLRDGEVWAQDRWITDTLYRGP